MLLFGESARRRYLLSAQCAVSRFIAIFISAWFSLQLLNTSKRQSDFSESQFLKKQHRDQDTTPEARSSPVIPFKISDGSTPAGKTIDLTLLAITRALDAIVVSLWHLQTPSVHGISVSLISRTSFRYADIIVFVFSSGTVMWAWFYFPESLPLAYNQWIGEVAQVDSRLIELLRKAHCKEFVYGQNTNQTSVLQSMCRDYNWPSEWGNPVETVPIPCEMVHMGAGPSCHWHAVVRYWNAFKYAFTTNFPLQLLVKARKPSLKAFMKACNEAVRSSAFMGAFVSLFYYGVCLARTLLGPRVFGRDIVSPTMWDSGLCVRAGCILCGWSILIESEKRRQELGLFVAPRALATLLPRQYNIKVSLPSLNLVSFEVTCNSTFGGSNLLFL